MMLAEASSAAPALHLRPHRFRSAALTHRGAVRKQNEDAVLDRANVGLWAVADGMGGHAAGDYASQAVVRHLSSVSAFTSAFDFRRAVRTSLLAANQELLDKADDELLDMVGSTVVTLMVYRGHYACIWAGDSRAYHLRDGRLERITRDHTLVREIVDKGGPDVMEAVRGARSSVITRAVGGGERLDLDGVHGKIEPGGRFLLCSDGLGVLSDSEIEGHARIEDPARAASALLNAALGCGAPDNVSVIVIDADGAEG